MIAPNLAAHSNDPRDNLLYDRGLIGLLHLQEDIAGPNHSAQRPTRTSSLA